MIKNIVFDMGRVLIDFRPKDIMERFGVPSEDRQLILNELFLSLEWVRMDRGVISDQEACENMCRNVPEHLHEYVRQIVFNWDKPLAPISGMAELVQELKDMGYNIYLLSNASRRQHEYWHRIPGSEYFDGTFISADHGLLKPHYDIYNKFFEEFSLTPHECLFIDDSPANIEGALCCGMQGIVFHNDIEDLRKKLIDTGIKVNA